MSRNLEFLILLAEIILLLVRIFCFIKIKHM